VSRCIFVALAFASLGAATIIPLAKPLKPLLGPLKKVVDGMRRFPAARHFAGVIGTSVKAAVGGNTQKIANLLPFILIAVELYRDPEVFEFIMNAIESEDDLWVWVNVIAETVGLDGGLDTASIVTLGESTEFAVNNPVPWLVQSAFAKRTARAYGLDIIKRVKKYSSIVGAGGAKRITKTYKHLLNTPGLSAGLKRAALKSGTMVRYFAVLAGAKVQQFARNSRNWRINRWFILFAISFLSEESNNGNLQLLQGQNQLASLIAALFSGKQNTVNGALFQISQAAYFHGKHRLVNTEPKLKAIEAVRPAFRIVNGKPAGKAYQRRVDLLLWNNDADKKETWVETKSLLKSTITEPKFANDPDNSKSYYRQFFHDFRLNEKHISDEFRNEIIGNNAENSRVNEFYYWYFHKFKNRGKNIPPTSREETKIREWFCKPPVFKGPGLGVKDFFYDNLRIGPKKTGKGEYGGECNASAKLRIKLQDTESYITEIVERLAKEKADEFPISDFFDEIRDLD